MAVCCNSSLTIWWCKCLPYVAVNCPAPKVNQRFIETDKSQSPGRAISASNKRIPCVLRVSFGGLLLLIQESQPVTMSSKVITTPRPSSLLCMARAEVHFHVLRFCVQVVIFINISVAFQRPFTTWRSNWTTIADQMIIIRNGHQGY